MFDPITVPVSHLNGDGEKQENSRNVDQNSRVEAGCEVWTPGPPGHVQVPERVVAKARHGPREKKKLSLEKTVFFLNNEIFCHKIISRRRQKSDKDQQFRLMTDFFAVVAVNFILLR